MHVLVGYDESDQAGQALSHALERYPDAEITAVHVNDPREWTTGGVDDGFEFMEGAYERVNSAAERVLEEAEAVAAGQDRDIRTAVLVGGPARQIVEYANEHGVDHIVLGSHGRRGISRFLLGSVSERVAERSPVSVTLVRTVAED
jgi:nucleotide-binding universal stress UspA family protein